MPEDVIPLHNEEVSFQIGRMYYEAGRPDKLEDRLETLSQKADDWEKLLSYAAMYTQWLNDNEKAAELIDRAMQKSDGSVQALVDAAGLMSRTGGGEKAIEMLQKAEAMNPSYDDRISIGNTYYMLKIDTLARSVYEQLYLENSADGQVVGGLLSVYERLGDYDKALQAVESWLRIHPNDNQARQKKQTYEKMLSAG